MEETTSSNVWAFLKESNNEDISDISSDMKCTICNRILINAHSSTSCGCTYCLDCVQAYLNGEKRFCPGNMDDCQLVALDINKNILPDPKINYKILKLVVGCRLACGFRCALRNMEEHERSCGKRIIYCPYVNVGCTQTQVVSDRINEHLVGESGAHATLLMACIDRLQTEHLTHVAAMEQQLAELRARVETQARDIELLGEKCRHSEEKLGELERQAREEKEQPIGHGKPDEQEREMEAKVEMQNRGQFDWLINGWAAKSQSAREGSCTEIFSEAFLSHENGYRMCLSACQNGDGADNGTRLSVDFHLMRGPSDNSLSWPFKREVTLSLINQRTGIDHASQSRTFDDLPDDVSWNRPVNERNEGIGFSKIIELAALSSTAGLIQDDTILIRCVVTNVTKK